MVTDFTEEVYMKICI